MSKLKTITDQIILEFIKEHKLDNPKLHNGVGVGRIKGKLGIVVYFESEAQLNNFPYKEETYNALPIHKTVIGRIVE